MPSAGTLKLIGGAIGALALIALVWFAVSTVNGWREDAAALPAAQQRATDAEAALKALDGRMTGALVGIAGKIDANQKAMAKLEGLLTSNGAAIDADVQSFLRRFSDALKQNASCPVPADVRAGLLDLFPAKPAAQRGAAPGRSGGAGKAGSSAAGGTPDAVPGRQRAAVDRKEMGMPVTAGSQGSNPVGTASGSGGAPDGRAAQGSGHAVPASEVRLAGWFRRAANAAAVGLALAGAAAFALVQDDGRDG